MEENNGLKRFTTAKFLNFALGFLGLQFAWQMRIILSAPVTEGLGASPFIYGLIWLAGPFTGMVVQPLIGAISDNTRSRFGRRRPYLFMGALISALALWAFPNSDLIAGFLGHVFRFPIPIWLGLFVAAIMIWIIDACINIAQGPYRALVPDVVPQEQHAVANSYISLAIGLGSVIAAGTAPFLQYVFHYQMSIQNQFIMAALAFLLAMTWTCLTIQEKDSRTSLVEDENTEKQKGSFINDLKEFFLLSPQVGRICLMQFFTWIGMMCMMIFFTSYSIHTVFHIPDLSSMSPDLIEKFSALQVKATNYSSICFAIFNLICFLIAIPIGVLAEKFGNKKVHIIALLSMVIAYLGMGFFDNPIVVAVFMALSGIGWASVCALPFAMLSKFIIPGTEGSVMGIFNIFIAGPQVVVCTLVSWIIKKCVFETPVGINYHWEYTFFIGAICLLLAALTTSMIQEKK